LDAQVLVEVTRAPLVENRHRGHAAVVDHSGRLLYSAGDPHHMTYWRSSAKPVQALPVVESGAADRYGITDKELALFCASHNGETMHTETVLGILAKIGLGQEKLQCGNHMPYHEGTTREMLRQGIPATTLHSNCSGKHSGMLTLIAHMGWDADNYLELEHPLQQTIMDYLSDLCVYPREQILIGIDGCGVPVHGLPLSNMSLAYARFCSPQGMKEERAQACLRVAKAMMAHPEMVGGTDRFCTDLMKVTKGRLIGKAGAAGVYSVGIMDEGIGISVKAEDGLGRGRDSATVEILLQLGYISLGEAELLAKYHRPKNINHRQEVVGEVVPVVKLHKEDVRI